MFKIFCEIKESLNNMQRKINLLTNNLPKDDTKDRLTHDEVLKSELKKDKAVEYFASTINGWLNMRMEITKTLVILSTGGIGVLLTFFKDVPRNDMFIFLLYIGSFILFVLSIFFTILVYYKNSDYFEWILTQKKGNKPNPKLYMNLSIGTFIISVFLSFFVAIQITETNETTIESKYIIMIESKINTLESKIDTLENKNKELRDILISNKEKESHKKSEVLKKDKIKEEKIKKEDKIGNKQKEKKI